MDEFTLTIKMYVNERLISYFTNEGQRRDAWAFGWRRDPGSIRLSSDNDNDNLT